MTSESPDNDFHVQDPPSTVPGSLAYVLRQERSDSPLDESQIVERERIRRILRNTENSQNVSQPNLSYLEDISGTQVNVPSPANKTTPDKQSTLQDKSEQTADSTETLSFPEEEKVDEKPKENCNESIKVKEKIPRSADAMADILNELLEESPAQESLEEVTFKMPEVIFLSVPATYETELTEMDEEEAILPGDSLGSILDIDDEGKLVQQSADTPDTSQTSEGPSDSMGNILDEMLAPEDPCAVTESELPEHYEERTVQENFSSSSSSGAIPKTQSGKTPRSSEGSPKEASQITSCAVTECELAEHSEERIVQENISSSEKDTVDELFEEESNQQTTETPNASQTPEGPSNSMGDILDEMLAPEDPCAVTESELPEHYEERTVQENFSSSSSSGAIPKTQSGKTPRSSEGSPEEASQITWVNISEYMKNQRIAPQKQYTDKGELLEDMKKLAKFLKIREGSKLKPEEIFRGLVPGYPAESGYLEKKYGTFLDKFLASGTVETSEKVLEEHSDASEEMENSSSMQDTVDRLFNEPAEELVESGQEAQNASMGEILEGLICEERNSSTESSSSRTISKVQPEKSKTQSGETSQKTWVNISEFMKTLKNHPGASQGKYTSQKDLMEDMKKLAKCLKIREGSVLKPEEIFRGLVPEYPAEPGYLEKKYGGFLEKSSAETQESADSEETPTRVAEEVSGESVDSYSSSLSNSSDITVIYRSRCTLPDSQELPNE